MRSKKRLILYILLVVIGIIVLSSLLIKSLSSVDDVWNWEKQLLVQSGTWRQMRETISFIGTVVGIIAVIAFTRWWLRYRNERDPYYWNGGYTDIPEDFAENGKIAELKTGRCGGGKSAMAHTRDFHQTAAAFLPPTKGQPTSTGFWRIY